MSFVLAQGVPLGQKLKKKKRVQRHREPQVLMDINSAKMESYRLKSKIKNLEFNT